MTEQFTLNNGVTIPALGYGVFQTPPAETATAVAEALKVGYRHIDTAAAYMNERGVGAGIRQSGIPREDIFIESKVWINDYGYEETLHAFEKATGKLGTDYIDLYILHQPLTVDFDRTIAAYKALETLLEQGKVRAIGVSNFMIEDLEKLLAATDVVPAVNQIEVHPFFQQTELQEFHQAHGILTQCWSPIGGITAYRGIDGVEHTTFNHPTITGIAAEHGKSAAQVMLRWQFQKGRQSIPKSVTPTRIAENFEIFDFELSDAELAALDALETGKRRGPKPADITLETFGVDIPEA